MFRFVSVDVSGLGPFVADQSVRLSEGLTVISGGNGAGKTTVADALRREFYGPRKGAGGQAASVTPEWLVFFSEGLNLPYGGSAWPPLEPFWPSLLERREFFETEVASGIARMLETKIDSGRSKFASRIETAAELHVTLAKNGRVNVFRDSHDISDCFHALGERIVLFLAINAAVRKVMRLDVPLVLDGIFGWLDECLNRDCYRFIGTMSGQTVVLETNRVLQFLGEPANIRIEPSGDEGRSQIRG